MKCMLRGDSGFASPEIYDLCEKYGISYVIRLRENNILRQQAEATLEIYNVQLSSETETMKQE